MNTSQENDFFVDIHCHPNMRAFNAGFPKPDKTMWENVSSDITYPEGNFARMISNTVKNIYKDSQSNLNNLVRGNVRVAFASLYPIERGFLKYRFIPRLLVGEKNINAIYEYMSGIGMDRINHLQGGELDYFQELQNEYAFVRDGQGKAPGSEMEYKIVGSFSELQSVLKNEPTTIAIILSIEGAHSFGCGMPGTERMKEAELKKMLTANVREVKSWEHPPFFLNLSHHFWNQLCGHCKSIRFPVSGVLNQNKGINLGMTDLGRHVVNELLTDEHGKRILIDIKHMSVQGRKAYYALLRAFKRRHGVQIPVICSHTGVNGYETMDASIAQKDNMSKSRDSYLHRWSINLSDEEIRIIHDSDGILGIMLDKGILGGMKVLSRIDQLKDEDKRKEEFIRLIFANIFQVVKAVGKKTAWDIINIGSDYDGGITHIDNYHNASTFVNLYKDLVSYLYQTEDHKELWFGYRPRQIVNKIMRENALRFLERHFV